DGSVGTEVCRTQAIWLQAAEIVRQASHVVGSVVARVVRTVPAAAEYQWTSAVVDFEEARVIGQQSIERIEGRRYLRDLRREAEQDLADERAPRLLAERQAGTSAEQQQFLAPYPAHLHEPFQLQLVVFTGPCDQFEIPPEPTGSQRRTKLAVKL